MTTTSQHRSNSLVFETLTLGLFFVAYLWHGLYLATAVLMVLFVGQALRLRSTQGQVPTLHAVSTTLVCLFGAMTLFFHNPAYIQWKTTVLDVGLGLALLLNLRAERPWFARLLSEHLQAPLPAFKTLQTQWACFWVGLGVANAWVVLHVSTAHWVHFKVFGTLALTLLASAWSVWRLRPYLKDNLPQR